MNSKYSKKMGKYFFRDDNEIFLRAWWFAHKVSKEEWAIYNQVTGNYMIRDRLDSEKERKIFYEMLGYTVSFVLEKLRDDIEEKENCADESYDLNLSYQIYIGMAFDEVFGLRDKNKSDKSTFYEIFKAYYDSNIYVIEKNEDEDKWHLFDDDGNFIVENLYAYRLNKIVKVVDRKKVTDNARRYYSNIGISLYKNAFFDMSLKQIKKELKIMVNQQ